MLQPMKIQEFKSLEITKNHRYRHRNPILVQQSSKNHNDRQISIGVMVGRRATTDQQNPDGDVNLDEFTKITDAVIMVHSPDRNRMHRTDHESKQSSFSPSKKQLDQHLSILKFSQEGYVQGTSINQLTNSIQQMNSIYDNPKNHHTIGAQNPMRMRIR